MLSRSAQTGRKDEPDVVVVGAGPAGLAAAYHLVRAGVRTEVVEAETRVGGRMATEQLGTCRLDRNGQLLHSGWPEIRHIPALKSLGLRPLAPGVLLRAEGRTHRVGDPRRPALLARPAPRPGAVPPPRAVAQPARAAVSGAFDVVRLRGALARLAVTAPKRLLDRPELPAGEALSGQGRVLWQAGPLARPLLAALLSDPQLTTSSRVADLVLRDFARGGLCLPAGGMATIPRLLAEALPEGSVHTGVRAVSVTTNSITTQEHGTLGCRAVVVATGARDAARLLPGLRIPAFHPVTVLHHAADEPPLLSPSLLVNGDGPAGGPVSHSWVASAVDPSRARPGTHLVTSVVLGGAAREPVSVLEEAARPQLEELYGTSAAGWSLLAAHHDPCAMPAMPVPHDARRPVRILAGLYVCGDHRGVSTAQGALLSARRAARAVLRDFGLPLPDDGPAEYPASV